MVDFLFARKMATLFLRRRNFPNFRLSCYHFSQTKSESPKKGLILGAYTEDSGNNLVLTEEAKKYDATRSGELYKQLGRLAPNFKKGAARIFYGIDEAFMGVCVVGLGKKDEGYNELEEIDQRKEDVRRAAAVGALALESIGVEEIQVGSLGDAEAAAEGVTLKLWKYQDLKREKSRKTIPSVSLSDFSQEVNDQQGWDSGIIKAEGQNIARKLMETPANLMTPTIFAENASKYLSNLPNVEVLIRDETWARSQKMNSFLSVSRGSVEPPIFLEVHYNGLDKNQKPVVFVGKGVTFDSGGISIKPAQAMDEMRGDMGGGACVFGAIHAAAKLQLPINVVGLIPLCENMPSGSATKPGDVVTARNGKTIQVNNTDAEGRLILADALCYAEIFKPKYILDIATLTGAMRVALGSGATGVFTNSTNLWCKIHSAGCQTGDRVWRMPLWEVYSKRMTDFPSFDVHNVGKGKGGGSCTAAAFLKEFVPKEVQWMHLDIAGVMGTDDETPYLSKGMTGRPTRTLIELLRSNQT